MPTVELQTNIVFISFFKIQFSVSDNTVISFQSKGRMGLFFPFYTCVWCLRYTQALWRRVKQSRGILSAQNNCKYLGPQLSHSFTTVETCQATKKKTPKLMWFHNFLVIGSSSKTGLSPLLFLPVHRVQNCNVLRQNWAQFYFWTVPAELCKIDCTLTFFFFHSNVIVGFHAAKKEIKIALRVLALLYRYLFQTTRGNR